jgi:hypothetical protein
MGDLSMRAEVLKLMLRCECGATVEAEDEDKLIRLARLHFGEFHPDLIGVVPVDAILAMAEQTGGNST